MPDHPHQRAGDARGCTQMTDEAHTRGILYRRMLGQARPAVNQVCRRTDATSVPQTKSLSDLNADRLCETDVMPEVLCPIMLRTFRGPEDSNSVGLIAEIPDLTAFRQFMQSDAANCAMTADGVHGETGRSRCVTSPVGPPDRCARRDSNPQPAG